MAETVLRSFVNHAKLIVISVIVSRETDYDLAETKNNDEGDLASTKQHEMMKL